MKNITAYITLLVSSFSLTMWAQPKISVTPLPAANNLILDSDEPKPPGAFGGFPGPGLAFGLGGAGGLNRESLNQVSVLCFKEPDQKAVSETIEDLAVLSLVLSRNLEQAVAGETDDYKLGIPMLLTGGKQAVTASYIQGFGAILKMQVRFPVVPPPEGIAETESDQKNSEWERARRELFTDDNQDAQWDAGMPGMAQNRGENRPYDPKLVQTLKHRVLVLLKNAAHVRHLDGNEWIIAKIVGAANSSERVKTAVFLDQPANANFNADQLNATEAPPTPATGESADAPAPAPPPTKKSRKHSSASNHPAPTIAVEDLATLNRPTIMTLRVKKSAVDAFEAGSLSEDQFIKQAEIATYLNPVLPGGAGKGKQAALWQKDSSSNKY